MPQYIVANQLVTVCMQEDLNQRPKVKLVFLLAKTQLIIQDVPVTHKIPLSNSKPEAWKSEITCWNKMNGLNAAGTTSNGTPVGQAIPIIGPSKATTT
jgi:hypothetical protein